MSSRLHHLISKKRHKKLEKLTFSVLDGDITYHQLEEFSGQVGSALITMGAKPGIPIPIVFSKGV